VPPLLPVYRAEVAIVVGPFVPDADLAVLQPANVGVAAQEPKQLHDDRPQVQLLRRQKREALRQVETHLRTEVGKRAGTGAVLLLYSFVENPLHEVEILAHEEGD
jgi:hypothetical protein